MVSDVWSTEQLTEKHSVEALKEDPMLWGVPGYLTQKEAEVFFQLKEEVEKRGGEFRQTVYCFGEEEGEVWALCRWCRARKYVLEEIVTMVEEAGRTCQEARAAEFYPNPADALGVEASLFFAQYPQVYSGFAKNGAPIFISKPGILNVDGMECITSLEGIIKFHWHVMMHDFAQRLRKQKSNDPNFKRFECFCVLDLNKLTTSQLTRRALAIIKEQAAIDSICFPETMSKMLIVNCPTFFSATWSVIKGWLDPRTASKIEVLSSKKVEKRLLELVDKDQLPSDYGGTGPDTTKTMMEEAGAQGRVVTKMLYLRGSGSETIDLPASEKVSVSVFTRSTAGANFSIQDAGKAEVAPSVVVKHPEGAEIATFVKVTSAPISGTAQVKVKAASNASRFSTHNYLIVFNFEKIDLKEFV